MNTANYEKLIAAFEEMKSKHRNLCEWIDGEDVGTVVFKDYHNIHKRPIVDAMYDLVEETDLTGITGADETPFIIDDTTVLCPHFMVLSDNYSAPLLALDIVYNSDDYRTYVNKKVPIYQQIGTEEYWILDVPNQTLQVFEQGSTNPYPFKDKEYVHSPLLNTSVCPYDLINSYSNRKHPKRHGELVSNLVKVITLLQTATKSEHLNVVGDVLDLGDGSSLNPDLTIKTTNYSSQTPPDVAIEVIDMDNALHEEIMKHKLYKQYGVKEFWIIDQSEDEVMCYDFVNDTISVYNTAQMFHSYALGLNIPVSMLFTSLLFKH